MYMKDRINYNCIYDEYNTNVIWRNSFSEDNLQEALILIIEKYPTLGDESELLKLAYTTALNYQRNENRVNQTAQKHQHLHTSVIAEKLHPSPISDDEKDAQTLETIQLDQIYHCLKTELSEVHRSVYTMFIIRKCEVKEIAELLSLSPHTVYKYIGDVNRTLKKWFGINPIKNRYMDK